MALKWRGLLTIKTITGTLPRVTLQTRMVKKLESARRLAHDNISRGGTDPCTMKVIRV